MANSNDSVITGKFRGTLGKELVFRSWEGKTVVAKVPKGRKGELSVAQIEVQDKFLIATKYANAVLNGADQGIRDAYAIALRPRQNLYSRAVEDFMTSPVVKQIRTGTYTGAIGSQIEVRAIDDFRVTNVRVEIYAANGTLLEKGSAPPKDIGIDFIYTATQANNLLTGTKIRVIATDIPGNEGVLEVTL